MKIKSHQLDILAKTYLLECITENDEGEELKTFAERIEYVRERFTAEYQWRIDQSNPQTAMIDWLQGLALPIKFYNYDILELSKSWGTLAADATEKEEDKILANYWRLMATKMVQLLDGFRIPFDINSQPEELSLCSFDYDHDVYGNPTAHYSVDANTVTKRRIQTGYDSAHHENGCHTAIEKAGYKADLYKLKKIEGRRSDGFVQSTWSRL